MSANLSSLQDEFWVDKQTCPVENCDWWFENMGEETWDGDYPDWIELYNAGATTINLNGYGLSDNVNLPRKWIFPSVNIGPGERLVVFASGKNITNPEPGNLFHTNFKIDSDGETILLTGPEGNITDQYSLGAIPPDFSSGRQTDGDTIWVIFENPTPRSANGGILFTGYTDEITSSHEAGFHSTPISVTLNTSSAGAQIRYTLDGSDPDQSSDIYSSPLSISSTSVLKARTYLAGSTASKTLIKTFIIGDSYSMPVVSLSTDPDNFWDNDIGIYVHGSYPVNHERVANYWQNWERPVTLEYFKEDGSPGFVMPAGVKILGWGSRANERKSLSVFFRDKYGKSWLKYPLFNDLQFSEYKAIVLRAAGNDWQSTIIRDVFASDLIRDKNTDLQRYKPAIVYINGEYWGIHNIREKLNEDYLNSHYGIDKSRVDIISRYWRTPNPVVIEGSDTAYLEMENYVVNNNMNEDEAYDYIKAIVDIDNFVDYLVPEIFYANYDWPGNNIKCWKPRTANSKWRWLFYDIDYAMASHPSLNNYTHNTLDHATQPGGTGWPNTDVTTLLIREIFEGNNFRNLFVNRMADYMNSRFLPDTAVDHLNRIQNIMEPEMQEHINRWGSYGSTMNSVSEWNGNVDIVASFLQNRIPSVKNHILNYFNLTTWNDIILSVEGEGFIRINSIIPINYPWAGQYVKDIPVTLIALPKVGHRFTGWTGVSSASNSTQITIRLSEVSSVTAHFEITGSTVPLIVINEVNYNSPDLVFADDWIELYNPNAESVDLSGWIFKDSDDLNEFIIPEGTIISADSYLVLCNDSADFKEVFPAVTNYTGEFIFGLSSMGETLRLYHSSGVLVDSVNYHPSSPWPTQANGFGPTLSLLDASSDNAVASNWGYSLAYGTPGASNENYTYISTPSLRGSIAYNSGIRLDQNYPNPFIESTTIAFHLERTADISLAVYDLQGHLIDALTEGHYAAGSYHINYNTSHLSQGIYYCMLKSQDATLVMRMIRL